MATLVDGVSFQDNALDTAFTYTGANVQHNFKLTSTVPEQQFSAVISTGSMMGTVSFKLLDAFGHTISYATIATTSTTAITFGGYAANGAYSVGGDIMLPSVGDYYLQVTGSGIASTTEATLKIPSLLSVVSLPVVPATFSSIYQTPPLPKTQADIDAAVSAALAGTGVHSDVDYQTVVLARDTAFIDKATALADLVTVTTARDTALAEKTAALNQVATLATEKAQVLADKAIVEAALVTASSKFSTDFAIADNYALGLSIQLSTVTAARDAAIADKAAGLQGVVSNLDGVAISAGVVNFSKTKADYTAFDFDKTINANLLANKIVTSVNSTKVTAGDGNDTVTASAGNDTIDGGKGDDVISAGDGSNVITAGAGSDSIISGFGNDKIDGGDDNDTINAWGGNNTVIGGKGDDSIFASDGNDKIDGGDGNDVIDSGIGNNFLTGGKGADSITSGLGNDKIDAGSENDTVISSAGNDTIAGGAGSDSITAGDGNDSVDAGADDDFIDGSAGSDTLTGGAGNDTINGGNDNDKIDAGDGNDKIDVGDGDNTVVSGRGDDSIRSGTGNDKIDGGDGNDLLDGGIGNNTVIGGNGADLIITVSGNDKIDAGSGNDTVISGSGNDTLTGGDGSDTFYLDLDLTHLKTVTDFKTAVDKLVINGSSMVTASDALHFATATTSVFTFKTFEPSCAYNMKTGALFYDADGLGVGEQVQIALIANKAAIVASDILI